MKEREAKEAKALEMFKHLKEYVGKEVTCTYWWYGEKEKETADLVELSDFAYVQIGTKDIPFVSNGIAIIEIASTDGKVLYANPYIEYALRVLTEIAPRIPSEKMEEYNSLVHAVNAAKGIVINSDIEAKTAINHVISIVGNVGSLYNYVNNTYEETSERGLK